MKEERTKTFCLIKRGKYAIVITVSKGMNPHELDHKRMKGLETRPQHEHESGAHASRYANAVGRVHSTEQSVIMICNEMISVSGRNDHEEAESITGTDFLYMHTGQY